jgi:hypothetical protein
VSGWITLRAFALLDDRTRKPRAESFVRYQAGIRTGVLHSSEGANVDMILAPKLLPFVKQSMQTASLYGRSKAPVLAWVGNQDRRQFTLGWPPKRQSVGGLCLITCLNMHGSDVW